MSMVHKTRDILSQFGYNDFIPEHALQLRFVSAISFFTVLATDVWSRGFASQQIRLCVHFEKYSDNHENDRNLL